MINVRWLSLAMAFHATPTFAQDFAKSADSEIIVYGRSIDQVGIATSGSEGVVGYADFENRPISRVGGRLALSRSNSGANKVLKADLRAEFTQP